MKELNIDLDFDDLVVTQITCKTNNMIGWDPTARLHLLMMEVYLAP